MTLNRQTLAKIDKQILSQMDHDEGVQLVKVPVSDAVWSTWRRYCDAVGIPMGRALALLLHQELGSLVEDELKNVKRLLAEREEAVAAREAVVIQRERELAAREKTVAAPPVERKLGRNDQCWCRSGKKYKFCHGRR